MYAWLCAKFRTHMPCACCASLGMMVWTCKTCPSVHALGSHFRLSRPHFVFLWGSQSTDIWLEKISMLPPRFGAYNLSYTICACVRHVDVSFSAPAHVHVVWPLCLLSLATTALPNPWWPYHFVIVLLFLAPVVARFGIVSLSVLKVKTIASFSTFSFFSMTITLFRTMQRQYKVLLQPQSFWYVAVETYRIWQSVWKLFAFFNFVWNWAYGQLTKWLVKHALRFILLGDYHIIKQKPNFSKKMPIDMFICTNTNSI